METIDLEALAAVSGGNALTAWLNGLVNTFAGHVGGTKLAETLYGPHATAKERARSQAAMTKFLAGGHKLPNIFGA